MTVGQMNFVSRLIEQGKRIQANYGEETSLNALWNGAEADYNDQITTEALQEVPAFAHLTQANLNELMYIVSQNQARTTERLEHVAVVAQ